jgi:glycosyltransferase involved in cell wall biosynthesis
MRSIHIVSNPIGSLGEITKDISSYLASKFKFTNEFETGNCIPKTHDILLSHFISPVVASSPVFNEFKYKILIQPIDGTKIHSNIVDSINEYDLILTPGKAGKRIMEENGVTKPILVIPNYYKPQILFTPKNLSIPKLDKHIDGKFMFYHESTCHPRKGIEEMCEAYIRAFSDTPYVDKVVLVIKASPHNKLTYHDLEKIKGRMIKLQKSYKKPAKILKISQRLDESILKKLWHRTDCYLHFAKIEGFGIPLLRMMMLGKPIIALYNGDSGYMDYLGTDINVKFISNKRIIAENEFIPIYTKETEWSIPLDIEEAAGIIKEMYLKPMTPEASPRSVKKYSIKTIMGIYEKVFNNIELYKKEEHYSFIESNIEIIND